MNYEFELFKNDMKLLDARNEFNKCTDKKIECYLSREIEVLEEKGVYLKSKLKVVSI